VKYVAGKYVEIILVSLVSFLHIGILADLAPRIRNKAS